MQQCDPRRWKVNGDAKDKAGEHNVEVAIAYQDGDGGVKIPPTKPLVPQLFSSLEGAPLITTLALRLVATTLERVVWSTSSLETLTVWFLCGVAPSVLLSWSPYSCLLMVISQREKMGKVDWLPRYGVSGE